jgi:hypothetical protein
MTTPTAKAKAGTTENLLDDCSDRTIPETPSRCRLRPTHATQETNGRENLRPMDETEADRHRCSQRRSYRSVRGTLASEPEDPREG